MNLKEFIRYQVTSVLLEIRGTFKWPEFKNLQSTEQMLEYAANNLKELGRGTSRAAFLLSNRFVLKVAIPEAGEKGTGQNRGELSVYTNPASKGMVTAIQDADQQGRWLVSEIARPLSSEEEFQKLTGVSWEQFVSILKNKNTIQDDFQELDQGIKIWSRRQQSAQNTGNEAAVQKAANTIQKLNLRKQNLQRMLDSEIVKGTFALMEQANVMRGDLLFVDHWGKTADGRVVLLDYGFTKDLADLYS